MSLPAVKSIVISFVSPKGITNSSSLKTTNSSSPSINRLKDRLKLPILVILSILVSIESCFNEIKKYSGSKVKFLIFLALKIEISPSPPRKEGGVGVTGGAGLLETVKLNINVQFTLLPTSKAQNLQETSVPPGALIWASYKEAL